jgi:transcriptional regulator with GAF, ATPase, and Fis domain
MKCNAQYISGINPRLDILVYKAIAGIARLFTKTNDLPQATEKLIGLIIELVKADEGAIQILKPASKSTRCTLIRQDRGDSRFLDKQLDDFLTGYVLEHDRAFLENNLARLLDIPHLPRRYPDIRSMIGAPIKSSNETIGVVNLIRTNKSSHFSEDDLRVISALAAQIGDFMESAQIRRHLFDENARLQKDLENKYAPHGIIGSSIGLKKVYRVLEQVIPTSARVIILGESGTGKELIARCIHFAGPRREKPFVAVDCGALPANLLESELFGYVRGAFTGAIQNRQGLIEEADGGTLFLDEITNMGMETQAKLLRFIQEGEIRPIGSNQIKKVDIRIIVAASSELDPAHAPEGLRADLYYRLNVISLRLPPLRERSEDIPELAGSFLKRFAQKHGKALKQIAPETLQHLENYHWPGNIRELENVIECAVVMADYTIPTLLPEHLGTTLSACSGARQKDKNTDLTDIMAAYEKKILQATISAHQGNQAAAARALNISESGLRYKLKRLQCKN